MGRRDASEPRACFVPAALLDAEGWAPLPAAAVRYLTRALRLDAGDAVLLRDRGGRVRPAHLARDDHGAWGVSAAAPARALPRPPGRAVWLAPALIKSNRFGWLLEKAAELGADRVAPVETARAVARWTDDQLAAKQTRFERILGEATRQAGGHAPPLFEAPAPLVERAEQLRDEGARLLVAFAPSRATPTPGLLEAAGDAEALALFTGPEGGLRADEVDALRALGAVTVSLGPRVLRAETAPIAMLAALRLAEVDREPAR